METVNTDMLRGRVDIFILKALSEKDGYGYDILNYIYSKTEGHYEMKQSSIYSVLKRLEKQGLVSSYVGSETNGAKRRYYSLTDEGRTFLFDEIKEWSYTRTLLNNLVSDRDFDLKSDEPPFRPSDLRPLTRRAKSEDNAEDFSDETDKTEFVVQDSVETDKTEFVVQSSVETDKTEFVVQSSVETENSVLFADKSKTDFENSGKTENIEHVESFYQSYMTDKTKVGTQTTEYKPYSNRIIVSDESTAETTESSCVHLEFNESNNFTAETVRSNENATSVPTNNAFEHAIAEAHHEQIKPVVIPLTEEQREAYERARAEIFAKPATNYDIFTQAQNNALQSTSAALSAETAATTVIFDRREERSNNRDERNMNAENSHYRDFFGKIFANKPTNTEQKVENEYEKIDCSHINDLRLHLQGEGINLRPMSANSTKGQMRSLFINRLLRDAITLSYLFLIVALLIVYVAKGFNVGLNTVFIVGGICLALPVASFLICINNAQKKRKDTVNIKVIFSVTVIVYLTFFIVNLIIHLLIPNGKSLNSLQTYAPCIVFLTVPFFGAVFAALYKTDKYHTKM